MEVESTADGYIGLLIWGLLGVLLLSIAYSVAKAFLGALTLGVFIYYCSRPIYRKLSTVFTHNTLNAICTIILFIAPFILILLYTFQTAVQEIQQIIFDYGFHELQPYFSPYINFDIIRLIETPEQIISQAEGLEIFTELLDYSILVTGLIGDAFLMLLVTLTVTFYLLVDDHRIRAWLESQMNAASHEFTEFADLVDQDLSSVYFGNILNAVVTATIAIAIFLTYETLAPTQLNILFPVLLGILAGVSSLIPMIGTKPVYFPVTGYLTAVIYIQNLDPSLYIYPLGFFIVSAIIVDFIPDMIIRPYVSGRNIHLGILLIAYISGPLLFGWFGFFLMPFFAVLFQHYYTLIFPKLLRKLTELKSTF